MCTLMCRSGYKIYRNYGARELTTSFTLHFTSMPFYVLLCDLLFSDLHVVAIDWPGHGQSSHRPRGATYSAFDYVADIQHAINGED